MQNGVAQAGLVLKPKGAVVGMFGSASRGAQSTRNCKLIGNCKLDEREIQNDKTPAWRLPSRGFEKPGGAEGNRTPDLYNAIVALSQLSYTPTDWLALAGPHW